MTSRHEPIALRCGLNGLLVRRSSRYRRAACSSLSLSVIDRPDSSQVRAGRWRAPVPNGGLRHELDATATRSVAAAHRGTSLADRAAVAERRWSHCQRWLQAAEVETAQYHPPASMFCIECL